MGREPSRSGWSIAPEARAQARELLANFPHPELHPARLVGDLPIAAQQVVEICRALAARARILLMDEPTSSLQRADVEHLFALIRRLRDAGHRHRLHQPLPGRDPRDCRRLHGSARRAERRARARSPSATNDAARGADGRPLGGPSLSRTRARRAPETSLLAVDESRGAPVVRQASFELRRGEVLGIAGLMGSGRTELVRAIFGLAPVPRVPFVSRGATGGRSGAIRPLRPDSPPALGYLSEDRKGEGLALPMSRRRQHHADAASPRARTRGWLRLGVQRQQAAHWMRPSASRRATRIRRRRRSRAAISRRSRSARLLHQQADVLLLDEPTRGIDIGSKAQIYDVVARAATTGKAVLMVSSYLPELFGLCDRLAVMSRGRLSPARPIAEWTPESVLHAAIDVEGHGVTRRPTAPQRLRRDASARRSTLARLGPFLGLVAVIAVFALLTDSPDQYLSIRNFRIVVAQTVIVALGAIGMTMIIVSGGIDLSVGSAIALTGVVTAIALRDGCRPLAGGAGRRRRGRRSSASSTACAITRLKVIPFIATLGTLGMARGVAKWIADQQTVNVPRDVGERARGDVPAARLAHRGARRLADAAAGGRERRSCCAAPSSAAACSPSDRTKPPRARAASRSIAEGVRSTVWRACCSACRA